ncbi:MAG: lysophospholipid acyltransferase family protein [Verrucomicrobiales bacterium]|nr:lysophospholipid acyltransferase family protein [Verrucomicrobiales bacterium]
MSLWKRIRYRIEWFGLAFLATMIPLLPRRGAHGLANLLGSIGFRVDYRGRRTARQNLRAVYGDEKSEAEIVAIAKNSYKNFGRTVVDQFWSRRLKAENYETFLEIEMDDPDAIESARETGAIWVTPHYSNFEWIALIMGFRGYRFTIIAQDFKNPHLTKIFQENREVSGHQVIPQKRALIRLLKNLKSGGHAAFLTDLNIKPSKAATVINVFGFKTCVTALHAELMKRTGLPVIPGICIPKGDGTYIMRGFPPLEIGENDTEQEIAQACWDCFEPYLRENPDPWLWMYKHWRYLPEDEKGGANRYPGYAQPSPHFRKLEQRIAGAKSE